MNRIECKEVIVSRLSTRGKGVKHSPIRTITQVFEKDGTLIAESDPAPETFALFDLIHFCEWARSNYADNKITPEHVFRWLDSMEK